MDEKALNERVGRIDGSFPSSDGRSTLRTLTWVPIEGDICGIVQLVHGMAEHIGRYEGFATTLAQAGFMVIGHDHVGHGLSVSSADDLGHLPLGSGADVLTDDVERLGAYYRRAYPELPFFLFGHSMGSFVARRCCEEFGNELDGAIFSGTGNVPVSMSVAASALCHMLARVKGERHRSAFVDSMGAGGYSKEIEGATGKLDWLSVNKENIERYERDPLCGFMFTVGAYASLATLTAEVATGAHAEDVPDHLPMFFISGGGDPVGGYGEGVLAACELYREAGVRDCSVRLYPGLRHEILNEDEHEKVEADVLAWLESHMPEAPRGTADAGADPAFTGKAQAVGAAAAQVAKAARAAFGKHAGDAVAAVKAKSQATKEG